MDGASPVLTVPRLSETLPLNVILTTCVDDDASRTTTLYEVITPLGWVGIIHVNSMKVELVNVTVGGWTPSGAEEPTGLKYPIN